MYIECNSNPTRSVIKFQGLIFQNTTHRHKVPLKSKEFQRGKKTNKKSPPKQGRNDPASIKVNNSVKIFLSFYLISHPRNLIKKLLHGRQILFEREALGKSPQWKLQAQKLKLKVPQRHTSDGTQPALLLLKSPNWSSPEKDTEKQKLQDAQ